MKSKLLQNLAAKLSKASSIVRIVFLLICLVLIWLPLAAPIYLLLNEDPNLVTILTMGLLFVEFLFLLQFWGKYVDRETNLLVKYGLVRTKKNGIELVNGLAIGFSFCISLFILEAILGWVKFNTPSVFFVKIVVEGLLSALGIGFAEELFFRGWILEELQRDYTREISAWINAVIFALAHFIKPLAEILRTFVTFPALVVLGLTLVWAKWKGGDRLGMSIGLHAGLVWGYYILNIGQLLQYTEKVPVWVTGIDGNPIAGLMGLFFLSILAWWMRGT
ncbi:MAG: type II CAAX endopeptidase family protein [Xenococcaceae cyanobacterium MO_188.B32]|nr:type II CAAX endopeptidase family protein [Xenococcaceae cyanobacterium MO_188.B32]